MGKAYPELKRVDVVFTDQLPANMGGSFNAKEHRIIVNTNYIGNISAVLAHEVQHAIQSSEGFAEGSNPEEIQKRFESAKQEWRARSWADALRDKAEEMGEHYNQAAVEKALIDEYKEMGMDNDEWMPDKETRIKGFNYFARGYADRSLDADIKDFGLNESTRSNFSPYVEYTKVGGEVESRNVEKRMGMTPEERRASLAAETEDVSREDQIFLMGDGDSYSLKDGSAHLGRGNAENGNDEVLFREDKVKSPSDMSDEEKSNRGYQLMNASAVDVKNNQIVKTKDISARKAAENWWKENIGKPLFYDTEVGQVEINDKSIGSSLAHCLILI